MLVRRANDSLDRLLFRLTVHDGGKLRHFRPDLVGDGAPLGACRLWRLLGKRGGDEGRDDTPPALSGMCEHVAGEMNSGAVEEASLR